MATGPAPVAPCRTTGCGRARPASDPGPSQRAGARLPAARHRWRRDPVGPGSRSTRNGDAWLPPEPFTVGSGYRPAPAGPDGRWRGWWNPDVHGEADGANVDGMPPLGDRRRWTERRAVGFPGPAPTGTAQRPRHERHTAPTAHGIRNGHGGNGPRQQRPRQQRPRQPTAHRQNGHGSNGHGGRLGATAGARPSTEPPRTAARRRRPRSGGNRPGPCRPGPAAAGGHPPGTACPRRPPGTVRFEPIDAGRPCRPRPARSAPTLPAVAHPAVARRPGPAASARRPGAPTAAGRQSPRAAGRPPVAPLAAGRLGGAASPAFRSHTWRRSCATPGRGLADTAAPCPRTPPPRRCRATRPAGSLRRRSSTTPGPPTISDEGERA